MIKCRNINTYRDTINYVIEERGITLTALVITIIILLILAGVGISVGRDTIESAKLMSFGTELQAMQTKVNELEQELKRKIKSNDNDEVNRIKGLGQNLQENEQESAAFSGAEISDTSGYRYYDKNTVEDLGFKNFNSEFLVNVEKRKVISLYGIKYRGKTIWTAEQLDGDNQYNVEYAGVESLVTFDLSVQDNGILVSNIQHTGNVKKSTIYYGQGESESTVNWKIAKKDTFETSCKIDNIYNDGIWYVKVEDTAGHNAIRKVDVTTVTFDANGGNVGVPFKKVTVGEEYGELPTPTREGYTFLGWNGKNLLNLHGRTVQNLQGWSNTNRRFFSGNGIYEGLTADNYYGSKPTNYEIDKENNNITVCSTGGGYGIGFDVHVKPNTIYTESFKEPFPHRIGEYSVNGTHLIYNVRVGKKFTFTTTENTYWITTIISSVVNTTETAYNIQIEEGNQSTEYEPYFVTSNTTVTQDKNHKLTAIWQKDE